MTDLHSRAGTGHGDAHFAVFADRADAAAVARSFARPDTRSLDHASGRPWLVGHWNDQEIVSARVGSAALALIGCVPVDSTELEKVARAPRDLVALDAWTRSLPGSCHLVAALDGQIRVQGTASGLRLVFHAQVHGTRVAATRADVLATALGAEPAPERLAARLLWPAPHPLLDEPLWPEVTAVAPDEALILAPDGRGARHTR
ncbi:hypothetical protein ABZ471_03475 [Streptomyces sp. NPDC005728]|uniref:hypothetical protein n=1 Tax=Streptomyces sp. NPDC005728 TaxID=3157054 RepID=UPI0033C4A14B